MLNVQNQNPSRRIKSPKFTGILRSLNHSQKTRPYVIVHKKENLPNHKVKIIKNEKRDKYLDLARELKEKLWNMKVMVIPIVIGVLGIILKGLIRRLEELEIGGLAETIQTTHSTIWIKWTQVPFKISVVYIQKLDIYVKIVYIWKKRIQH